MTAFKISVNNWKTPVPSVQSKKQLLWSGAKKLKSYLNAILALKKILQNLRNL